MAVNNLHPLNTAQTGVALKELLDEMRAYETQFKVRSMTLRIIEPGQPLTRNMLRDRFDATRAAVGIAKSEFQFRDLRATAATSIDEAHGIKDA